MVAIKSSVRLTKDEVIFLAGALFHAEKHYDEVVELKIDDSMTKHAELDRAKLETIQKKIGIR